MEQIKQRQYNAYVLEQKQNVTKLLSALNEFEKIEDMQGFSQVEDEFNALVKKLKEMAEKPEEFVREFDEEEDW